MNILYDIQAVYETILELLKSPEWSIFHIQSHLEIKLEPISINNSTRNREKATFQNDQTQEKSSFQDKSRESITVQNTIHRISDKRNIKEGDSDLYNMADIFTRIYPWMGKFENFVNENYHKTRGKFFAIFRKHTLSYKL